MGAVYLAALIVGLGISLLQVLMSSDADADHGDIDVGHGDVGHGDVGHGDVAHGDFDHAGGANGDGAHHADGAGMLAVFMSLRFWTYAALGFGLVGALLHYLDLAAAVPTAGIAAASGLGSGAFAAWVFRALAASEATSGGESDEMLGQVGRVVIGLSSGGRGKVRLEIRGRSVEYIATTDETELKPGELVMVEEVRGTEVHVSPAPAELKLLE